MSAHDVIDARIEFVDIYKRWIGITSHDRLHEFLDSEDIRKAMKALDVACCGGVLTTRSIFNVTNQVALKDLHIEGNIFAEGHKGHAVRPKHGVRGLAVTSENGQTTIYIDAFHRDGSPRNIESILGILVHEMAHAIYGSFACSCRSCNRLDPMVLGPFGHGRLWVELAEHMRDMIRSWDEALNDFYTEDLEWMHNWKPRG